MITSSSFALCAVFQYICICICCRYIIMCSSICQGFLSELFFPPRKLYAKKVERVIKRILNRNHLCAEKIRIRQNKRRINAKMRPEKQPHQSPLSSMVSHLSVSSFEQVFRSATPYTYFAASSLKASMISIFSFDGPIVSKRFRLRKI